MIPAGKPQVLEATVFKKRCAMLGRLKLHWIPDVSLAVI